MMQFVGIYYGQMEGECRQIIVKYIGFDICAKPKSKKIHSLPMFPLQDDHTKLSKMFVLFPVPRVLGTLLKLNAFSKHLEPLSLY